MASHYTTSSIASSDTSTIMRLFVTCTRCGQEVVLDNDSRARDLMLEYCKLCGGYIHHGCHPSTEHFATMRAMAEAMRALDQ